MGQEEATSTSPGDDLCLEFTDTLDWRTSDHAKDTIATYGDLLSWSVRKRVLEDDEARRLAVLAEGRRAEDVVSEARTLREAIYRLFLAAAHGKKGDPGDVSTLNGFLGRALAKRELQVAEGGYTWGWCGEDSMDKMLYPVAESAAELLTSDDLRRVKECANQEQGCGSLFIDASKSQSRRWCSMKSCGNRSKFRTYYQKHVKTTA